MFGVTLALFFMCCSAEELCSRYHYEEQTLAKVLRLEYKLERLEEKVSSKDVLTKTITDCPDMWMTFNGSCYLFEDIKLSFFDARSYCQRFGADLVHVNDYKEKEFLRNQLKKMTRIEFWIGLKDNDRNGIFKWVDDNTTLSFTGWAVGQPDKSEIKEDCVHFHAKFDHKWNDNDCRGARGSICEKKSENTNCQNLGADLVHVNDYAENELLRSHLKTLDLSAERFWIGLDDIDREGSFEWVDDKKSPTFVGWHNGQPDNSEGREDCVHFHAPYNYTWNDSACHNLFGSKTVTVYTFQRKIILSSSF